MASLSEAQIFKEVCENDFAFFVRHYLKVLEPETEFIWNWHIDALCHYCERVYYGDYQNLDINIPPRLLKTLIISVLFPCWIWTKNPSHKILSASRSFDLSIQINAKRKQLIESPEYQRIWPVILKKASDSHFSNYSNGFMKSVSALGKVTGEGADCFAAGTLIETDKGPMTIEDIHLNNVKSRVKVLSYNHEKSILEYKRILATRKTKSNRIVKTEFDNGARITSTSDHKFFTVGRGYEPICNDGRLEEKRFMSFVRKEGEGNHLRRVSKLGQDLSSEIQLHEMSECGDHSFGRHDEEGENSKEILLHDEMSFGFGKGKASSQQKMQGVRRSGRAEKADLFRMQENGGALNGPQKDSSWSLSKLPEDISEELEAKILLEKVQESNPCKEYDGNQQPEPLKNNEEREQKILPLLFSFIEENKGPNQELLHLRIKREASCSSHRLELQKQRDEQSSSLMPDLPYSSPQDFRFGIDRETKALFQESVCGEIDVYDLEVEDNHNFFADGILVHNCLLSDDLIDAVDAFSKTKREAVNRWFSNAWYNRAQSKKRVRRININQRTHTNDVSGHIAENHNFHTLIIPMVAMSENPSTCDFVDPRKEGEFLFPSYYGQDEMDDDYKGLGAYGWSSQYQQVPRPIGGGIIKEEWIRRYKALPNSFSRKIIVADLSFKGNSTSDFVSFQYWGVSGGNKYLLNLVRGKWSYKESKEKFVAFCKKNDASAKYIEDKANGPALISDLKSEISGLIAWPQKGSSYMNADKVQRLHLCSQEYEMGNVYFPEGIELVETFIEELVSFTEKGSATGNDDMVDTSTMALLELKKSPSFFVG